MLVTYRNGTIVTVVELALNRCAFAVVRELGL